MKPSKILAIITMVYMFGIFYYTIMVDQLVETWFQAGCGLGALTLSAFAVGKLLDANKRRKMA